MEDIYNPDQPKVSIDPLGNQDIMNNPFGDYLGKSTEITDLVMNQQQHDQFDRLTNNLNTLNNNLMNNGSHDVEENVLAVDNSQNYQLQQDILILNDDNNNSNDNFNSSDLGPETDVDAMEDNDSQATGEEAAGGEKERTQFEDKDIDEVQVDNKNQFMISDEFLGSKPEMIKEEVSQETFVQTIVEPLSAGIETQFANQVFGAISTEMTENSFNSMQDAINPFMNADNAEKISYQEQTSYHHQFMDNLLDRIEEHSPFETEGAQQDEIMQSPADEELISANEVNEEVAIQSQQEQQQTTDLEIIGTAQAIEESDGSDDEWNYISNKVEDKKETEAVSSPIVEEHNQEEQTIESSVVEEEEKTAPIEVAEHSEAFEENLAEIDNKYIREPQEEEEIIHQQEESSALVEDKLADQAELIESSVVETVKETVEEERHVLDEIEKDLALEVETEESNDMDSQLNPDAKEFVPLSPVRNEFQSPPPGMENGKRSPFVNQILSGFSDPVVSQSPRKGENQVMEDVAVPELNEFEKEADARAHEVNLSEENFQRIESPIEEEINLKEAMQTDDKLEQGYKDDSQGFFEEEKVQSGDEYKVLESSFDQYSNGFQSKIDDPMNRSFYEGRDNDILADPAKSVLNTTQPLFDDDQQENGIAKGPEEVDFLGGGEPVIEQAIVANNQFETMQEKEPISQMESSDNFEAEKFVEEIKGINDNFNKYVDTELSPTAPKAISNEIEETIFATHSPMGAVQDTSLDTFITQTSAFSDIVTEKTEQQAVLDEFDVLQSEMKENIPQTIIESVQQDFIPTMEAPAHEVTPPVETVEEKLPAAEAPKVEEAKIESKTEEIAAAAAAIAVVGTAAAATAAVSKKPSATTAAKKPETKKVGDVKAKVPSKPAEVKKTEVKPKTTTTKPSPTTTAAKAPITKPAPSKSATSTLAAARPKTTTTVPPVKKAPLSASKPTDAKPPISKTSTVPKRPITSAPTTRPAPARPTTEVKSKVNGTTERKPLASSAPATRAPATKPTSLTVKSRVNGTSATTSTAAKSPSATKTSARLSTSAIEKSASSPLKEKSLNKSLSTTTAKSPRTVTSTSTTRTTTLKSPSTAARPALSAVGTKKPLSSTVKKSPTTEKTSTTTVTKKPAVGTTKSSTTVKKTTTTTVNKKKVVNGDIVEETKNTTTTESTADVPELNGHHVNGSAENGVAHEIEQQVVVESTAD